MTFVNRLATSGSAARKPVRHARRWSAAVGVIVAVAAGVAGGNASAADVLTHIDSMYPTANTAWRCTDGGLNPGNRFCQTDNSALTWFPQGSLSATGRNNIANRMSTQYGPTHLTVTRASTPSYTGAAETDIIFQQGTSGVSQDGVTWCNDATSTARCDQHYVRFRSASPSRSLACHETGHAVGLTHGRQASPVQSQTASSFGCMKTPTEGTAVLTGTLTSQINATY